MSDKENQRDSAAGGLPRRIIGIDWATEAKKRAAYELEMSGGEIVAVNLTAPLSDEKVVEILNRPDVEVIAVDIPFGWPCEFSVLVGGWIAGGAQGILPPAGPEFMFRQTDRIAKRILGRNPLSISSDRIALGSRAWLSLIASSRQRDRVYVGVGDRPARPIIEVYPAASLAVWSAAEIVYEPGKYKSNPAIQRRLLDEIKHAFSIRLVDEQKFAIVAVGKDDSDRFDSFIAAVTGLAFAGGIRGWKIRMPDCERDRKARREGWIFLPYRDDKFKVS